MLKKQRLCAKQPTKFLEQKKIFVNMVERNSFNGKKFVKEIRLMKKKNFVRERVENGNY